MKRSIQQLLDVAPILQCPQCARHGEQVDVLAQGTSLVCTCALCAKVHRFDVSSRGSVNMVPAQKPLLGYTEQFFAARRAVIEHGWYSELIEQVCVQVVEAARKMLQTNHDAVCRPIRIADIGCGEGSYAHAIARYCAKQGIDVEVFGVDLAKDAIHVATTGGAGEVRWIVADLAALPFASQSMDIVCNIFTPANYAEFQRILTPHGVIIKAVPAADHMAQVKATLAQHRAAHNTDFDRVQRVESSHEEEHSQDRSAQQLFAEHCTVLHVQRITQHVAVEADTRRLLPLMTPVLFHREHAEQLVAHIDEVTLDALLVIGQM